MVTGKLIYRNKRMVQLRGNLRKKNDSGLYYYRLTIANGKRKEFALKTHDEAEAIQKAADLDAVWEAPNQEIAFAQINAIKGFSKQLQSLPLSEVWAKYEESPNRAHPQIHEHLAYESSYRELVSFLTGAVHKEGVAPLSLTKISEVTYAVAASFSEYLKTTDISVHTHNRKLKRIRKIFDCLTEYYDGENPFRSPTIYRKNREEQNNIVKRQAFTKEQEEQLRAVLADPKYKIRDKQEIRVIYYLGMYTGQRLKDCVLLQWQNVDMSNRRRIWVKQFKTGKEVTIPMAPQLYEVLKEAKRRKTNQYVNPVSAARYNKQNGDGKNVGNNLVNLDVLEVIRWIGLEPSVSVPGRKKKMTVYGFHSLRHSFCSFCAEAGISKAVLLSILGTESEIADKYYTHVGNSLQEQAIHQMFNDEKEPLSERVQKVLKILETDPEPTRELLTIIKKTLIS